MKGFVFMRKDYTVYVVESELTNDYGVGNGHWVIEKVLSSKEKTINFLYERIGDRVFENSNIRRGDWITRADLVKEIIEDEMISSEEENYGWRCRTADFE